MTKQEGNPRVREVGELSKLVSWYIDEGYCTLEELIFADTSGSSIVPISEETVTLLSKDTPAVRALLDTHMKKICEDTQALCEEDDSDYADLYADLIAAGANLDGVTRWDMFVLDNARDNLLWYLDTPLKAAAMYVSAKHLLGEKNHLVEKVSAITMQEFIERDELAGDVFNDMPDGQKKEHVVQQALDAYWDQNATLREAFTNLSDQTWDAYGAASVLLNTAEVEKQQGNAVDMDLPVVQSILDVLAEHGMNLPEWLFLYDNRESILFNVNIPAFLFTQDWFADCIKQTLDSAEFEPGERIEDYEPWYDFLSSDARIINDRQFQLVEDVAHAFRRAQTLQDTNRKKWELLSQLGAIEAIYGKKGWEWLQCALASAQENSEEDPNQAWLNAGELLYDEHIDALRSGNLAPEAYTRMYLAHASRFPRQPISRVILAKTLHDGAQALSDTD